MQNSAAPQPALPREHAERGRRCQSSQDPGKDGSQPEHPRQRQGLADAPRQIPSR